MAAAFGVFNPDHIAENLAIAWKAATPAQYWAARVEGATLQLERLLGPTPDGAERATELLRKIADASHVAGRPFFGGLSEQAWPGTLLGDLWHAADLVREHRGDTHTAAWTLRFTAPEIMMLTDTQSKVVSALLKMARGYERRAQEIEGEWESHAGSTRQAHPHEA